MIQTTHELKILPKYFDAIINGSKNFEIRKNDREYKVGDALLLREWNNGYTRCSVKVSVTYVLKNFEGLKDGYVAMGIKVDKIKIFIGGFDDMPKAKVLIFVLIIGYAFAEIIENMKKGKRK